MYKIKDFLNKYWLELLVLITLSVGIFTCASVNLTWMMVDSDGAEYVMDAQYFYPAHHTSAPLYLLLGHLFLQIPFGTDYWRMSLMSAIFTIAGAIFIYLIIRHLLAENKNNRQWACLGAFIFGASALVFAQAIIVETYAVVTFFSIASYYFVLKKRWAWASAMLGMGLVTHHLILLTWAVLFIAHTELRPHFNFQNKFPFVKLSNLGHIGITAGFLLCYIYMPLSIMFVPNQPQMWGNTTIIDFFTNNISVFTMLVGQLSIYDLPKRIFDTLGILGISLGVALIPIGWWMWKTKKLRNELFWLFTLPIVYYCFPAGTKIITKGISEGRLGQGAGRRAKNIENIVVGDTVLTYNENTGLKEWKQVEKTYNKESSNFVHLKFSNGNELKCTNNHPIGVNRNGHIEWVDADMITIGDEVVQAYYHNWQRRVDGIKNRGKTVEEIYGQQRGAELRKKNRDSHIGGIGNPTKPSKLARLHLSLSHMGYVPTVEQRRKIGEKTRKSWENPEYRENIIKKSSETKRKHWANDPRLAQKMLSILLKSQRWHGKLTKPELQVKENIDSCCPNEFAYNGDGKIGFIGRYAPDFVNINGKKQIVEVFGCYHHNCVECNCNYTIHGVTAEERRNLDTKKLENYQSLGYKCLVIWQHELKKDKLTETTQKIKNFLYNPDAEVIKVVGIERYKEKQKVYNIETKDNHNYFAYGILVHNCTDLAPQVAKYIEASMAWGAIIAVMVLSQWWNSASESVKRFAKDKFAKARQAQGALMRYGVTYAVVIVAVALFAVNVNQWDIGRTLDPNLSATEFYEQELPKIPDGQIFITMGAWEWIEAFKYDRDMGRDIIPVCVGTLASEQYRNMLRSRGVIVDELDLSVVIEGASRSNALNHEQVAYAMNIIQNNPDVWTSRPTDPSTYGAEVVLARGNENQITRWLGSDIVEPQWQFQPSNPYDVVTGAVEISEWNFILQSNKNCLLLIAIIMGVILLFWIPRKLSHKKEDDFEASIPIKDKWFKDKSQ